MASLNPLRWFGRDDSAPALATRQEPRLELKGSAAGEAISAVTIGQPVWTDRRFDALAEEGYARNAVAYRCVRMIATAAATVPWLLYRGDQEVEEHDLLRLLAKPAPGIGGHSLFEAFFAYLLLSGNGFLEAVGPDQRPPRELWTLRPDRMKIIAGRSGLPAGYEYEANGRRIRWDVDAVTGKSPILHMKEFNPLNDWYGMSPLEAAAYSIDRHNAAGAHNVALLQNGASPSGALVFKPVSVGQGVAPQYAPQDVIKAAEDRLESRHQGAVNAGRPMVLGGDIRWEPMGLAPKDMDFNEGKLDAARDICLAFGVPPILIVEGQSTYNNVREAKLALYEETVLPLLDKSTDHLNEWLVPQFGDDLRIAPDLDEVPALESRRESKRNSVRDLYKDGLLTRSEARAALQYDELDETFEGAPDAAVITALLSAYDQGASTVQPLRRYLVAMGLLDASVTDEDMISTARGIAKQLEVPAKRINIAQAAAMTGEVSGEALGRGIELVLAGDRVLPDFEKALADAADEDAIRFGGDGEGKDPEASDRPPQDRASPSG
ncbi:phage portal protein [Afifella sp. H1R]|uniref:phage portal protein n=1 Tax=Afifella sp. H1R TaxID=2908841 RepID=UPI001F394587|nr:phage portal protein [Afifella sp. H1R]MCF1502184.1 phage portal protein [Afifella sp. H1R]